MNTYIYRKGNVVEWKKKIPLTDRYATIFRAYMGEGVDKNLIESLDIVKEDFDTVEVVNHHLPFQADIVKLNEENLVDYEPVDNLSGKTVFLLIHGINSGEITQPGLTPTFYTIHRREVVHSHIKRHFEDATILHFIYPSALRPLERNAYDFVEILENLPGIENVKKLYIIGYSLGGLVMRCAIRRSSLLRHILTAGLTINTPHRGTPLVSISFAPAEFWEYSKSLWDDPDEAEGYIRTLKDSLKLTYMSGSALAPGYLALRWDSGEHFDKFPQMVSPTLKKLNEEDRETRYIFSSSIIPTSKVPQTLKLLLQQHKWHKFSWKVGLMIYHRLMVEIGRLLKVNMWPESDGATPLSSQLPVKYIDNFSFQVSGPFAGDHIGIILSDEMWERNLEMLSQF